MIDSFAEEFPEFDLSSASPVIKIFETLAYRETLFRNRVNESSKGVMLAYARGTDLDNLAALLGVKRALVKEGDPKSLPPLSDEFENDDRLRERARLAFDGFPTAGSRESYLFHALSADPRVKDIDVRSSDPGTVTVTVLGTEGNGTPSTDLLQIVEKALNEESVRPLTDRVIIEGAHIRAYAIKATLFLYPGPDQDVAVSHARNAIQAFVGAHHKLGHDIALSGLFAALHGPLLVTDARKPNEAAFGIQRVDLQNPTENLILKSHEAAFCTGIELLVGGRDV